MASCSYSKQNRQGQHSSWSQCWSVPCQIDRKIAWNFLWGSTHQYYSLFCPYPHAKLAHSELAGVCIVTSKLEVYMTVLNAAVMTIFERCCHTVDTIFPVLGFSLFPWWCCWTSFQMSKIINKTTTSFYCHIIYHLKKIYFLGTVKEGLL